MTDDVNSLLQDMSEDGAELSINDIYLVEDILQHFEVFYNDISGKPCHSDSFMACVDYQKLYKDVFELPIPERIVKYCIQYWLQNPNNQPPLRMVALAWERHFQFPRKNPS